MSIKFISITMIAHRLAPPAAAGASCPFTKHQFTSMFLPSSADPLPCSDQSVVDRPNRNRHHEFTYVRFDRQDAQTCLMAASASANFSYSTSA